MDMSVADPVRDELLTSNTHFRELVHQHEDFEKRLSELAHLTYPNDDEQLEEAARLFYVGVTRAKNSVHLMYGFNESPLISMIREVTDSAVQ